MSATIKLLSTLLLLTTALMATLLVLNNQDQALLRKHVTAKHQTYTASEPNYDFCMQRCTDQGGVNCGGLRKGCCTSAGCTINKIYKYQECATGASVQMGTTKCIGYNPGL